MSTRKKKITKILLVFGWVGVLIFLISLDTEAILRGLYSFLYLPNKINLLPAVFFLFLAMIFRGLRWHFLIKKIIKIPVLNSVFAYGWLFLPSMFSFLRSGEALKAHWISSNGGDFGDAIVPLMVEKILDILFISSFLFILLLAPENMEVVRQLLPDYPVVKFITVAFILLALIFLIFAGTRGKAGRAITTSGKYIRERLRSGAAGKGEFVAAALSTIVIWMCVITAYYFFFLEYLPGSPYFLSVLIVLLVNVAGMLNLSPANIGPYELVVISILTANEYNLSFSTTLAIQLHSLVIITIVFYCLLSRLFISGKFRTAGI